MENPWANAWDEPHKSQSESITTATGSAWALKLQNASVDNEREADIATPSWVSAPVGGGNEHADHAVSLWGTEEKGDWTMGTSSYESIDFGTRDHTRAAEIEAPDSSQESEEASDEDDEIAADTLSGPTFPANEELVVDDVSQVIDPWTPSRSTFTPSDDTEPSDDEPGPIASLGSPDAFGTFETALPSTKSDADPWFSPPRVPTEVVSNDWGTAWAPSDSGEDTETEKEPVLDEWEAARRQKEIQDKYVPPEVLASILKQFEDIADDLWLPAVKPDRPDQKGVLPIPAEKSDQGDPEVKEAPPSEKSAPPEDADAKDSEEAEPEGSDKDDVESESGESDGWNGAPTEATQSQSILRAGMEDVEGLQALSTTIIPPLTLPTSSPFSQTFTCKRTAEAVRLTRNAYITRSSPMAKYLQTKGSIAWEVAVKSRIERNLDEEVLPAGWRIIEKSDNDKELPSPAEMKRKTTGGILSSLFSRRAATPPATGESTQKEQSASPRTSISSARPSTDSGAAKNGTTVSSPSRIASPTPSSLSTSLTADATVVPSVSAATNNSGATTPTTSYADAGSVDLFPDSTPQPAPSAVSRFLNRFSRNKSSPRNSLALSSDDLEFLSDIVPSVSDDVEDGSEEQLKALSNMIGSAPLPTKLPPPLAPPPRATGFTAIGRSSPASGDIRPSNATLSLSQPPLLQSPFAPTPLSASRLLPSPASPLTSPISPVSPATSSATSSMIALGGRGSTPSQSSSLVMKGRDKVTSTVYALSPPHSTFSSLSSLTQKRATPVAKMSTTSDKPTIDLSTISFLPPPPSVPSRPSSTVASSSLLLDSFESDPGPSNGKAGSSLAPPTHAPATFDDDDFADFHSASFQSPQPDAGLPSSNSLLDSSFISATSDQNFLSGTLSAKSSVNSPDLFDDFDDFVSSPHTLRTPSPPRPPAKSPIKASAAKSSHHPPLQIVPPPFASMSHQRPPEVTTQQGQIKKHQRKVSREEHRRTQSLLESAAAQKGRWPAALPSPLPPILSPPPGGSFKQGSNRLDIFSGDENELISPPLQTQQSKAMAGLGIGLPSSVSSPAVLSPSSNAPLVSNSTRNGTLPPLPLPPAPQQQTSPILMDLFGSALDTASSATSSNAPLTSAGKAGGLSAQDLSFFEGL